LGFPLGSLFSTGTILGRIFQHPSNPLVGRIYDLWPAFALLAVVSVVVITWILRREFRARRLYATIVTGMLLSALGFYGLVALWRDTNGIDERFLKPVGFLIMPGLIEALRATSRRWMAWILGFLLVGSCAYGVAAYANRAVHLERLHNVGRRGVTQHVLSPAMLDVLHRLDTTLPVGSLIVVPSPEMALELNRTRVLSTDAAMRDAESIGRWRHAGTVPRLVVLSNLAMQKSGQSAALLTTFVSYPQPEWSQSQIGEWTLSWAGGPISLP
jgi:predicted outer membrane lipoprotein